MRMSRHSYLRRKQVECNVETTWNQFDLFNLKMLQIIETVSFDDNSSLNFAVNCQNQRLLVLCQHLHIRPFFCLIFIAIQKILPFPFAPNTIDDPVCDLLFPIPSYLLQYTRWKHYSATSFALICLFFFPAPLLLPCPRDY